MVYTGDYPQGWVGQPVSTSEPSASETRTYTVSRGAARVSKNEPRLLEMETSLIHDCVITLITVNT
jgi:hypothetical protein